MARSKKSDGLVRASIHVYGRAGIIRCEPHTTGFARLTARRKKKFSRENDTMTSYIFGIFFPPPSWVYLKERKGP